MKSNLLEKATNYNNIIVVFVSLMTVSHKTDQNPPNTSRLPTKQAEGADREGSQRCHKEFAFEASSFYLTGTLEKHMVQVGNTNTEPESSGKAKHFIRHYNSQ